MLPWVVPCSATSSTRLLVKFHETLSEASVYMRYFHVMQLSQRIAHERTRCGQRLFQEGLVVLLRDDGDALGRDRGEAAAVIEMGM